MPKRRFGILAPLWGSLAPDSVSLCVFVGKSCCGISERETPMERETNTLHPHDSVGTDGACLESVFVWRWRHGRVVSSTPVPPFLGMGEVSHGPPNYSGAPASDVPMCGAGASGCSFIDPSTPVALDAVPGDSEVAHVVPSSKELNSAAILVAAMRILWREKRVPAGDTNANERPALLEANAQKT
jgi:hypothetical protein